MQLAQNDKFTEEEMHNYRMAVTEREVGVQMRSQHLELE